MPDFIVTLRINAPNATQAEATVSEGLRRHAEFLRTARVFFPESARHDDPVDRMAAAALDARDTIKAEEIKP